MQSKLYRFLKIAAKSFALAVPGVVLLYLTVLIIGFIIGVPFLRWKSNHEIAQFNNNKSVFEEMQAKLQGQDKIHELFITSSGAITQLNACRTADIFENIFVRLGELKDDFPKGLPGPNEIICENEHKKNIVPLEEIYTRYDLQKAEAQWYIDKLKKLGYEGIGKAWADPKKTVFYLNEHVQIRHRPSTSAMNKAVSSQAHKEPEKPPLIPDAIIIDRNWVWMTKENRY